MTYLIAAGVIVLVVSVRTIGFAVWQFRNKNIVGGIMVSLIAILAVVTMYLQF